MREVNLETIELAHGAHQPDHTYCAMELSAYIAEEPWTDSPKCVDPSIAGFIRSWNDSLNDKDRQMLKPYVLKVINTRGSDELARKRYMMAFDWTIREMVPAWLDLAGLHKEAKSLRNLREITEVRQLENIAELSAARSAAYSAARSAAYSAARSAADSAARSAAYSAARSAADSAAYSAAYSAARSAATSHLRPTVELLQKSALQLLDRMIECRE